MKTATHKSGFTLIELTVSIGIFILIFVSMTQIFFLMQGTIARINAQREMVAWLSTITQTITTDLENYSINVENSNAETLVLTHVSNGSKVIYRSGTAPRDNITEATFTREVVGEDGRPQRPSVYRSPLFYFSDVTMRISPDRSMSKKVRCALLPAISLRFEVKGDPEDRRLANLRSVVQTSFSSNVYPLTYSQLCQSDHTKT